jgi:tripeptidyl-peptidase-1
MGVTFLFSSGDYGVAGSNGYCLNAGGTYGQVMLLSIVCLITCCIGTESPSGTIFNPSFPSTCPYVTSVGATQMSPGASVTNPEIACTEPVVSGGGFSNYFAIPDYQTDAVTAYFQNYSPPYANNTWNSTGTVGCPRNDRVRYLVYGIFCSLVVIQTCPPMGLITSLPSTDRFKVFLGHLRPRPW